MCTVSLCDCVLIILSRKIELEIRIKEENVFGKRPHYTILVIKISKALAETTAEIKKQFSKMNKFYKI